MKNGTTHLLFFCLLCSCFFRCGETNLDRSLEKGDLLKAKAILTLKPAYLQSRDEDGRTRLHLAVLRNRKDAVELLISKGADVNAIDRYGYTPLHYAAQRGYDDIGRYFLDHNADVGATTPYGYTPLHWAAECGHEPMVRLLIDRRADLFAMDKNGRVPAQSADEMGHWRVARQLYPLHWAACQGDTGRMKSLLDQHPDLVSIVDGAGRTALHLAMRYDQREAIQILSEKGADAQAKDAFGFSPAYYGKEERSERTGINLLNASVEEEIDHEVYRMLSKYHSVNVGIVIDGEIVFTRAYGDKSLMYECAWGSVSKPVTAMLVMHLVSHGKIESIDDPIWKYSRRYRNCMPEPYTDAHLTIRHLLTHTSGVPHNDEPTWKNGKLNLKFEPGTKNQYSTPGYGILGHIIEDVTEMSYSEAVKTYIGNPVGATSFRAAHDFRAPGARVYSNIHDQALFSIGVINHVYVPLDLFYGEMIQYHNGPAGMGWGIQHLGEDDLVIFHGGSNGKPQAHLFIQPRKRVSVSLLASARDPKSFELDELSFRLLSVLEGIEKTAVSEIVP